MPAAARPALHRRREDFRVRFRVFKLGSIRAEGENSRSSSAAKIVGAFRETEASQPRSAVHGDLPAKSECRVERVDRQLA